MGDTRGAAATQRIINVLQILTEHPGRGVEASDLIEQSGGFAGTPESQRDALSRDLRNLRRVGFDIVNLAGDGADARYLLRPGDDRVRVAFTRQQLFELQRAAVLVGVDRLRAADADPSAAELGDVPQIEPVRVPEVLGEVQRAVATRAVVKFDYSGKRRTVHPYGLQMATRGWVLDGWEEGSGQSKLFSLQKMASVAIGRPETASPPERSARPTLDPLRFAVDDPVEAVLRVGTRFRAQVDGMLHHPLLVEPGGDVAGEPTELLHYTVTNHMNFVVRVLRLDERVELLGGDTIRAVLRSVLRALAEVQ